MGDKRREAKVGRPALAGTWRSACAKSPGRGAARHSRLSRHVRSRIASFLVTTSSTQGCAMKNEGITTTLVEEQTKKIPSFFFLALAFGAIATSAALMLRGRKNLANFVGQW